MMNPAKDVCISGKAGFSDRLYIYSAILGLDQYMYANATLHVPVRSCDAFDWKHHNGGISICNKSWGDYLKFPSNVKPDYTPTKEYKKCKILHNPEAFGEVGAAKKAAKAANVSEPKRIDISLACKEHMRLSSVMKHPPVLLLHVRRGDLLMRQKNAYLTSVAHVNETWHSVRHRFNTTFFSTNENDPAYLSAMARALQPSQQLDKLLERAGCGLDSFCIKCNIIAMVRKGLLTEILIGHNK